MLISLFSKVCKWLNDLLEDPEEARDEAEQQWMKGEKIRKQTENSKNEQLAKTKNEKTTIERGRLRQTQPLSQNDRKTIEQYEMVVTTYYKYRTSQFREGFLHAALERDFEVYETVITISVSMLIMFSAGVHLCPSSELCHPRVSSHRLRKTIGRPQKLKGV